MFNKIILQIALSLKLQSMIKRFVFLVVILAAPYCTNAQSGGFAQLLWLYSHDRVMVKRLKNFRREGIERHLDLHGLTPNQLIDTAKTFLGTPHCMGGTTHRCIDCSGLLYASFRKFGIIVPHSSQGIARYGRIIVDMDSLSPGDLVFFVGTYNTSKLITHSGIYLGDYQFIHTSYRRGVIVSDLRSDYYKKHFIFGTRIF